MMNTCMSRGCDGDRRVMCMSVCIIKVGMAWHGISWRENGGSLVGHGAALPILFYFVLLDLYSMHASLSQAEPARITYVLDRR